MAIHPYPRITSDPEILGGRPVIEGTAVPVSRIVEQVAADKTLAEVAAANSVSVDDVRAALEYAATRADEPVTSSPSAGSLPYHQEDATQKVLTVEEEARALGLDPANLSPLGRRLIELRLRGIAAGEPLLSTWEELEAEIRDRRGGVYPYPDAE